MSDFISIYIIEVRGSKTFGRSNCMLKSEMLGDMLSEIESESVFGLFEYIRLHTD